MNSLILLPFSTVPQSNSERKKYVKEFLQILKSISFEKFWGYYDITELNKMQKGMTLQEKTYFSKVVGNQWSPLENQLPQWDEANVANISFVANHVWCAATANEAKEVRTVDYDAATDYQVKANKGNTAIFKDVQVYPLVPVDIHIWISETRSPQRFFDPNYEKHSIKPTHVKGKVVSPWTLTDAESQETLIYAYGMPSEDHLYSYDKSKGTVYVFDAENISNADGSPMFHDHEVKDTDNSETSKIPNIIQKAIGLRR